MIEITNVGEVNTQVDKWLADVEVMTTKFCRGMSVRIFEHVLNNSVQYSGDFAANWKYELNSVTPSFVDGALPEYRSDGGTLKWRHGKGEEFKSGYFKPMDVRGLTHLAKAYALRANRGKDASFKLGDTIYIHNSATHDEAYAQLIEDGAIKFRVADSVRPLGKAKDVAIRDAAGGAGALGGEALVMEQGYKEITARAQLDSLRRRPGRGLGA